MNINECDHLDAYLADRLPAEVAARFEAHAQCCSQCGEAIDEQRWIDELLQSPVRVRLETPAIEFAVALKSTLAHTRQRAGLIACVVATAAAIVVAAGWAIWSLRNINDMAKAEGDQNSYAAADEVATKPMLDSSKQVTADSSPRRPPRAIVFNDANTLVVPIESHSPDVTIVRLYPVYQPEYTAQANASPHSASDNAWPDSFNGGTP